MKIVCKIDHISEEMIVWEAKRRKAFVLVTEIDKNPAWSLMIDFLWPKVDILHDVREWDIVEVEYSTQYRKHKDRRINNVRWHSISSLIDIDADQRDRC